MDIRPTPTDEEAAAIAAAIELSWPRAVASAGRRTPASVALRRSLVDEADPRAPRPTLVSAGAGAAS